MKIRLCYNIQYDQSSMDLKIQSIRFHRLKQTFYKMKFIFDESNDKNIKKNYSKNFSLHL